MIRELADIRIAPGKGAEFDTAIICGVETVIFKQRRAVFAATRSTAASKALSATSS